jgi:hypothetical protein
MEVGMASQAHAAMKASRWAAVARVILFAAVCFLAVFRTEGVGERLAFALLSATLFELVLRGISRYRATRRPSAT